ncbi:MAG: IS110 family transposase [Acholeplasmataceae bacterium]|jgi:transposase|nr:IS110 family transposase [Acholeplasmataceae bacterium]
MNTLPIAGIDVGKEFSEMVILSPANKVYARMKIFHDSFEKVDKAISLLKKAEKDFANRPIIAMEATGHYHKILFRALTQGGFEVVIINPIQTDCIKNLGIRKVKSDKVDAKKIAILCRFQEFKTNSIPNETIDCLKNLCRQYYKMVDQLTVYKNKLISVVDQVMLNFTDVFKDISSKTALALLEKYPTPVNLLEADENEIISLISKNSRKSVKWATEKYNLLMQKAKEFKPLSISNQANVALIHININMIRVLENSIADIKNTILELIDDDKKQDIPILALTLELLCSIPGIGLITAATILAEVGDFSAFQKPQKLVAYFGIDPSVNQSGKFEGNQNKMAKRGSRFLRRVIYTSALSNIRKKRNGELCNSVLYEYYQNKCISKPRMVALGAIMHKLVKIIFAVLRDKKPFEIRNPEEHAQRLKAQSIAA